MFLKVGGGVKTEHRLYLFGIEIQGKEYIKIGKSSSSSSKRRLLEVCGSFFDRYRHIPKARIIRDRKCEEAFKHEANLHKFFDTYRVTNFTPFSGSTEFFDISPEVAIQAYEAILSNIPVPENSYLKASDVIPF